MRLRKGWLPGVLAAAFLAGCGSTETTSLMLDGPDQALTLELTKSLAWSDWEAKLVVRRFPECQRRHDLGVVAMDGFKMEVFSPEPGAFILKQGRHWYVTALKSCAFQEFQAPPPEPGTPVGAFLEKEGSLEFKKAP